jgi:maleate isomerase
LTSSAPGPFTGPRRIGLLVPASNTNAEPLTAAVLRDVPEVEVFASRFRLPASLDARIDSAVLGDAVPLIAESAPDVIAFHGTAGSWTGVDADAALAVELAAATGASAGTTATQAMYAALAALGARSVTVVFPGSDEIVSGIAGELGAREIEVFGRSTLPADLTNPQIAALGRDSVETLLLGGSRAGADAVLCVGTNLRAGYLAGELEEWLGLPVVDSAVAVAWHVLRLAGVTAAVPGWGSLLRDH